MPTAASSASPQYQALYRATVQEAAAGGNMLMGKLVAAARQGLQVREAACRDLRERDALAQSAKQLRAWEAKLCERYPHALLEAFTKPETAKKAGSPLSITDVGFDELELMDEVQVLTSVTLARTQQVAMLAAEASLAELNTLICSTLGMGVVNAERNPLRPQIYVNALKAVVEQTGLPPACSWTGSAPWAPRSGKNCGPCTYNYAPRWKNRVWSQQVIWWCKPLAPVVGVAMAWDAGWRKIRICLLSCKHRRECRFL